MKNPNCDNDKCASATGEIRVLPLGSKSYHGNSILCERCYQHEMSYRRKRNRALSKDCQFETPSWNDLKIYAPATN